MKCPATLLESGNFNTELHNHLSAMNFSIPFGFGVEKSGVGMSCNRVNSIGYDKIGAVFILLAIAMSLSSIIMSVELLIKKVMNKGG